MTSDEWAHDALAAGMPADIVADEVAWLANCGGGDAVSRDSVNAFVRDLVARMPAHSSNQVVPAIGTTSVPLFREAGSDGGTTGGLSPRRGEPSGTTRPEPGTDGRYHPPSQWLVDAADLLAEPDPGPTAWLLEDLLVDRAIAAIVGRWKTTKSYGLLDLCIAIATGRPAFGRLIVPEPGPVVFINEESGRAALWRRLDALSRGRAIDPEELRARLHVAANARVRLDDLEWQNDLVAMGAELHPRLIAFDPLVRMKSPARKESAQEEMAVVVEFLRRLRDETDSAVAFVHHVGHQGEHMRGSSDLESAWESRLAWKRDGQSPDVTVTSEHREAEAGAPITYRINWDGETRSMRFDLVEDTLAAKVRAFLAAHPAASKNAVAEEVGGNRAAVLTLVDEIRAEDE